jgi:hypothetical protein
MSLEAKPEMIPNVSRGEETTPDSQEPNHNRKATPEAHPEREWRDWRQTVNTYSGEKALWNSSASPWQSSILHLRLDGLYTSNLLWGMANLERSERENKERKSNVPPSALDSIPGVSMLGCQCFVKYQFSGLNYLIIFDFIVLGLLGFLFKWSTLVDCWSQCFLSVFGQLFGNWQKRGTPSCSCTEFSQFNPFACETYIYIRMSIYTYVYLCVYIYIHIKYVYVYI